MRPVRETAPVVITLTLDLLDEVGIVEVDGDFVLDREHALLLQFIFISV